MKDRNGYVLVYLKDHHRAEKNGVVYEHILVAEQILGRDLKKDEVVHHIDGNRSNNNPKNLMIFATNGDHTSFHAGNKAYNINGVWYTERKRKKVCPYCGKEYFLAKTDNYNRRKYCSVKCARAMQGKLLNNSKIGCYTIEELQALLYENNGNFTKVGKMLGISSNAIVNRLKRRNLPYHSENYKP